MQAANPFHTSQEKTKLKSTRRAQTSIDMSVLFHNVELQQAQSKMKSEIFFVCIRQVTATI